MTQFAAMANVLHITCKDSIQMLTCSSLQKFLKLANAGAFVRDMYPVLFSLLLFKIGELGIAGTCVRNLTSIFLQSVVRGCQTGTCSKFCNSTTDRKWGCLHMTSVQSSWLVACISSCLFDTGFAKRHKNVSQAFSAPSMSFELSSPL